MKEEFKFPGTKLSKQLSNKNAIFVLKAVISFKIALKWWNLFSYLCFVPFFAFVFFTRGTFAWYLLKLKLNVVFLYKQNVFFSFFKILNFLLEMLIKRQSCFLFWIVGKTMCHLCMRKTRRSWKIIIVVSFFILWIRKIWYR